MHRDTRAGHLLRQMYGTVVYLRFYAVSASYIRLIINADLVA